MKKTALAPSNIAFIKYWGKKDENLRLPENGSISMCIDNCTTKTTVEFSKDYAHDEFILDGKKATDEEARRVFEHLDRIRDHAHNSDFAKVVSVNNFPKSSGIASSASGFAALTVAGFAAAGVNLSEKELSLYARLGSGSACRSIPDGFVEWQEGTSHETSFAYSLYPPDYWDICDVLAIVDQSQKSVSSTAGQTRGKETSIFHETRVKQVPSMMQDMKQALTEKNFKSFGEITEKDSVYLHSIMMSSTPALFYWSPGTIQVIREVIALRDSGIPAYFTIDAGPNVHVVCEQKNVDMIKNKLHELPLVTSIILNKPAKGTRIIDDHLF